MPRLYLILIVSLVFTGCGFLDRDLELSDAEFGESLGAGGIGMSGFASSGCGCGGYFGSTSRTSAIGMSHHHTADGIMYIDMDGEEFFFSSNGHDEGEPEFVEIETPIPSSLQRVAEGVETGRARLLQAHVERDGQDAEGS